MIRLLDIVISSVLLLFLAPAMILISCWILIDSRGEIVFRQERIGVRGKRFKILKFRTMMPKSESKGLLTVGDDLRVTRAGRFLRKRKLDELPQLFNVLSGQMSMVGPRPEVMKYVEMYSEEQRRVLEIKPGITDIASLEYFNESDLLSKSENPETTYIEEIMPRKIELNMNYVKNPSVLSYFKILARTVIMIIS